MIIEDFIMEEKQVFPLEQVLPIKKMKINLKKLKLI